MLHIPALWDFDTSVTYPQWFQICCQICCNTTTFYIAAIFVKTLLHNRRLVVITHELIYGVRTAFTLKLWKVVQSKVELMRINFKFESPIIQVQIITYIIY